MNQLSQKIRIPKKTLKEGKDLYPYQKLGVQMLLKSPSTHQYLADDMGLGKTPQMLAYANTIGAVNLLIVVPGSIRLKWLRETFTWYDVSPHATAILSSRDFQDIQKKQQFRKGYFPTPLITSYDLLVKNESLLKYVQSINWDLVLFDEFHNCRNLTASRTQIAIDILESVPRAVVASGTPLCKSAADMFPALTTIVPYLDYMTEEDRELCSDYYEYCDNFTFRKKSAYSPDGYVYKGVRNRKQFYDMIRKRGKFFIRRTKKQVLTELPDVTFSPFEIPISVEDSDSFDGKYVHELLAKLEKQQNQVFNPEAKIAFSRYRHELGTAIASSTDLHAYIEELIEGTGCVVIFFVHKTVRDILKNKLAHHGVVVSDGETSPQKKQKNVDLFMEGKKNVFLAQVSSAQGYDLYRASEGVFVEYSLLSTENNQAIKRLDRIGQKNAVTAHFVICDNEFHKICTNAMIAKQKMIADVMNK